MLEEISSKRDENSSIRDENLSTRDEISEKNNSISPLYKSYKTNSIAERLRAIKKSEKAMTVNINFVYLSWPITVSIG